MPARETTVLFSMGSKVMQPADATPMSSTRNAVVENVPIESA
jgi:hypothetical protein